jgi:hypothetical protein
MSEMNNPKINPIKKLRQFVSSHPGLLNFSTQRGFGMLIGRSEQYVKALESKPKITQKLAQQIETRTGASAKWLLSPERWPEPIPMADGRPLNHEVILAVLKKRMEMVPGDVTEPGAILVPAIPGLNPYEYVVDGLLKSWKSVLIEQLTNQNRAYYIRLLDLLVEAESASGNEGSPK